MKTALFIGRFQPFHVGHKHVVENAITSQKYNQIIFLIGSSHQARTPKNPFTFNERKKLIEFVTANLLEKHNTDIQISILPLSDYIYDNQKWISEVQHQVNVAQSNKKQKVVLIGNKKDKSSEYLDYFPQYDQDFSGVLPTNFNGATEIRSILFENHSMLSKAALPVDIEKQLKLIFSKEHLPEETIRFFTNFVYEKKDVFANLQKEYHFIVHHYQKMMESLPYKNIAFFTGDTMVTCAGHILLIKRKVHPGKGMFALPGGFFDAHKDLSQTDTAIRELLEETRIKIPNVRNKKEAMEYLESKITRKEEFGDFNRSERWRIITKVSYIKLPFTTLPEVKGGDDAAEAFWMPFSEIVENRDNFFEDHLSIIDTFLNILTTVKT